MKKKGKAIKPDEIFEYGPFRIERYGNNCLMQIMPLEDKEREDLLRDKSSKLPNIVKEINDLIVDIKIIISELDPLELLKNCYMHNASLLIGKTNESEIDNNTNIALRMIEYIQCVIVSTPVNQIDIKVCTEEIFKDLYLKIIKLYDLINNDFHIARSSYEAINNSNFDPELDSIYVASQLIWNNVRGDRYTTHEFQNLKDLLIPHNEIIYSTFNITVEDFVQNIEKIYYSLTHGLANLQKEYTEIHAKAFEVFKDHEKQNKIHGFDLFNLNKITNLPDKLLDELSYVPGENDEFFDNLEFSGWPLKILPTHKKPFLKIDNDYYCFDLFNLMDHLYRIMQKLIIKLNPVYKEEWPKKQQYISESLTLEMFEELLPEATIFQSNYYYESGKKELTENDGLVIYDDLLIIIEVKAGSFTYTDPTTDFEAHKQSFINLLLKPSNQGERLYNALKDKGTLEIFDSSKKRKTKIFELNYSDFRQIIICPVTIDNFTSFASRHTKLESININLEHLPIWPISIDDLRVYVDIIESPLFFSHFLTERIRASKNKFLEMFDEIDHLGLYLKINKYSLITLDNMMEVFICGARDIIDEYYHYLYVSPEWAIKPKQNISERISEILHFILKQSRDKRLLASSIILDLNEQGRNNFARFIDISLQKNIEKQINIPFIFAAEHMDLYVYCCIQDIEKFSIGDMVDYSYANLIRSKNQNSLLLILDYDEQLILKNVTFEFIDKENIPKDKIDEIKKKSDIQAKKRVDFYKKKNNIKKIGRNELCPCNSGKKYKKCCNDNS